MKIAVAQLNYTIGDFHGNTSRMVHQIERAKREGAELIVFSELSVTGYYPHDLLEKKEFISDAWRAVQSIASACQGIAAIVGAPRMNEDERGKTLYNSALLLADGAVKSIHDKTLLPTYDIFDEYRHFESNRHFHVAEYHGVRIAITICEDLWDELPAANEFGRSRLYRLSPMEELAKQNPSVVVNISASPFSYNQESWRKDVLISKARQYRLPLLYVNQTGAQAELIFDGGSVFIGPDGQIIKELKYFEEDFCLIDTDAPGAPSLQPSREPIEKMHQALLLGIADYFRKTGFRKAVLGLSGGIDSALTAVLAVQALGAENVHGLLLPSKYSSECERS